MSDAAGKRAPSSAVPSVELCSRLVEHSLGLMCVHDLEGTLLFVNPAAAEMLGYNPAAGTGRNLRDFLSPAVASQFSAYLERIRTKGVDGGLMRVVARDGTERIWLYRNVLSEEPGEPPRVLGHAQDVTDHVRAEAALKESEQRFRRLADTAPVLIWMGDPTGRCTFLNQSWLEFTQRTREEELGEGWAESIHPADRDRFVEAYRTAVAARRAFEEEFRLRRGDGEYRWVLGRGAPRVEVDGACSGLIGSCVDITEIRRAREVLRTARDELAALVAQRTAELERSNEQLRVEMRYRAQIEEEIARARRIESVGVLAGGVAHEFNNLLTVIAGRAQLLLERPAADELTRADLLLILRTVDRAAALTQQLLAFGTKQLLQPRLVNLNRLVAELELSTVVGPRIEVATHLAQQLRAVRVDPVQFQRAIFSLVDTARERMAAGGRLVLETANVDLDAAFVRAHPEARVGPHVRLTIRDTGTSLDEVTRRHIFEPFFTAKPGVPGSGLEFAAAHGITKQHGGYMAVENEPPSGTTVAIYLPAADQVGTLAAEALRQAPAEPHAAETILLIEDEEDVRQFLRDILERQGYRVIEMAHPHAALSWVERHQEPIHLVLTDVVMPGMSGPVLAERLGALCPGVKVLYVSGYTGEALGHQGMLIHDVALLEKPFTAQALLAKVRDVLGS